MCDTVVLVRPEAESPRVLFAKNSDRDPNEAQVLEWHPAREHPAGARVACTWIEIPQVARTEAVLLSRPFWMWGAEMGVNAHGVVIGNEAVFTKEPVPTEGLTGMDLLRLTLERSRSATEAVEVLGGLLDSWPQGGGMGYENRAFRYHSSFLIADPTGAYVVETAGRERAVEPVSEGRRAISNALTIPALLSHSKQPHTTIADASTRRSRMEALTTDARSAGDLFRALRDHGGSGSPRYRWHNGAMSAPCMHAGGLLAASQTTGSLVVEFVDGQPRIWATGTSAPCTGLFKPVRVDQPVQIGHPGADPDESLWWRHERLHRAVMADPERLGRFSAERDAIEQRWLAAPPAPEAAFQEADELLARWTAEVVAQGATDVRPWVVRRYWRARS